MDEDQSNPPTSGDQPEKQPSPSDHTRQWLNVPDWPNEEVWPFQFSENYRLIEPLEIQGGGGAVYKARDLGGATCVIKIPRREGLPSPELVDRFMTEIENLKKLKGIDGVVGLLGEGEVRGMPYYAMPYVQGDPGNKYFHNISLEITVIP